MDRGQSQAIRQNMYFSLGLWLVLCGSILVVLFGIAVNREEAIDSPEIVPEQVAQEVLLQDNSYLEGELLECYSRTVVLDIIGQGEEALGVMESVAQKAEAKLAEEGVKMFVLENGEAAGEKCLKFLEMAQADFYLQICVSEDGANAQQYGVCSYYNEEYYIPGFGNLQLADTLLNRVAYATSNRALGLTPVAEDSLLRSLQIPGAQISLGYLSNEKERGLLLNDTYREMLAEGLAEAVLESFRLQEEAEEGVLINREDE